MAYSTPRADDNLAKPRNVSGAQSGRPSKTEEGKGGLQQFVVGMVMEKPLPFEDFKPMNGSRVLGKGPGHLRSGSAKPAAQTDHGLTRTTADSGAADMRINLLREFMVPNSAKAAPPRQAVAVPMKTLLEQNKSQFKPISIDVNSGPVTGPNGSQVGGSKLASKGVPGVLTFGKEGLGTFGSKLQIFDTKSQPMSGRKAQTSPPGATAGFHHVTTDSQGFRVFDEQLSMALRTAERQATPNLPTQTEITEEDRIEEYSLVERSLNARLTPAKSN